MTPEERYGALVEELIGKPGVTPPSAAAPQRFGSTSLKVNNKIFAMLVRGRLVVKLPAQRVDALTASGEGIHFDTGKGQLMKEWLSIEPAAEDEWRPLATEAMEFVGRPAKKR
jgi:TfoX/Sxy family transcriptional regulator of competence genes